MSNASNKLLAAACAFAAAAAFAQAETPFKSLPYTPGLDVKAVDRTVDPCEDFYRYSCGGWIKWRDYSAVGIRRGDFFGNVERASLFESHRDLAKIGKPVDRTEWACRARRQHAGVRPRLLVQTRRAPRSGETLPGVVTPI